MVTSNYGLLLQSTPIDSNTATEYAYLTHWFDIRLADEAVLILVTTTIFTARAVLTTTLANVSTVESQSATTTAEAGGTGTTQSQSPSTGTTTSSNHNRTPSIGAIAIIIIVVIILLGVAIFMIARAIVISQRRRRIVRATSPIDPRWLLLTLDSNETIEIGPSSTTETLPELPEDPKLQRAEVPGQCTHPIEKDADDVAPEKKTVLPQTPIELEEIPWHHLLS